MCNCMVCARIQKIKEGTNPYFVKELETGYVVFGDFQRFPGYTLFLCKEHAMELHELEKDFRDKFLQDMAMVSEAVYRVFQPDKLNYELLGVGNAVHMHWHIFPRRAGDTPKPGPVWKIDKTEMYAEEYRISEEQIVEWKQKMLTELERLQEVQENETK